MRKKLVSVLLILCMFASLMLGACGSDEKENDKKLQMSTVNDLKENVIDDNYRSTYEVFVYSYCDSNNDGIGDIPGLISKLDYIDDLGFNQIWLMPIMPSPSYHKYDVTNYMDIDSQYGSMEDFEKLVDECHKRDINVIIDLVLNHSSSEHEWFKAACDYLTSLDDNAKPDINACPYVDYYNFTRESGKAGHSQVKGTNWYYESQFVDTMPDYNLDSELFQKEIDKIVDFWIGKGVDGFRLDAVGEYTTGDPIKSTHQLRWIVDSIKDKKEDAYIVGEGWTTYDQYAMYYGSGIDSMFDFSFAEQDGYIAKVLNGRARSGASTYGLAIEAVDNEIGKYTDSYIDAPFYTNHDMGRGAGYYTGDNSVEKVKMAQAMNLLMSGNSFLYYGEEIGMKGAANDETKRLGMLWTDDPNADGMCDGPENAKEVEQKYGSLEDQKDDPYSIYNFVKQTMKIRNAYPEIARGKTIFEKNLSDDKVCVLSKEYEGEKLVLIYNTSDSECTVDVNSLGVSDVAGVLQTTEKAPSYAKGEAKLPAYSVLVLK